MTNDLPGRAEVERQLVPRSLSAVLRDVVLTREVIRRFGVVTSDCTRVECPRCQGRLMIQGNEGWLNGCDWCDGIGWIYKRFKQFWDVESDALIRIAELEELK